ncbi:DUF4397 domain-containing protein [Pseudalkalibacillus caeni]|uniref:DUF4397 domain-containing protein n=1 Tax=Exobacillus caeni TaxID=2574798 RepID=A0A5R9F9D4_9BACL|nr:DUF4397 domain-containing protein [Pseudalkalibacillus caeni]TLS37154.1 DUF4397 domain-containing protein [Pseudalkalibacillus caeni]
MKYHSADKLVQKAAKYDLLASYYKYIDPAKHIHYYQKHFYCMQQLMTGGYYRPAAYNAMVRVFHASPDAPAVDVYINGQRAIRDLTFKEKSDYFSFQEGSYQIQIYPAGNTNQPVLTETISVEAGKMYTVAAAGKLEELKLITAFDTESVPRNKTKVRFWHLSPDAPAVDVAVRGGEVLFRNVPFGKATRYLKLDPTTVDLEVRIAGTETVVLTIPNVRLKANKAYTAVAVGLAKGTPELQAMFLKP